LQRVKAVGKKRKLKINLLKLPKRAWAGDYNFVNKHSEIYKLNFLFFNFKISRLTPWYVMNKKYNIPYLLD